MNRKLLILACLPLALSGCIAQSRIQAKYMDQESTCRSEASRYVTDNPPPPADANVVRNENSTPVFAAFSACMNKAGWKVSVPKTQTATTQPPYGAPGPGGVVGSAAKVSTNPQPTTAAPIIGPGVQPNPATSSTVPRAQTATTLPPSGAPGPGGTIAAARAAPADVAPAVEAPATYQPAGRPDGAAAPSYGSGAGRNF